MNVTTPPCTELITEPDILASIASLPTEDDLPCDDGEPMDTPRHQEQMILLIHSLESLLVRPYQLLRGWEHVSL